MYRSPAQVRLLNIVKGVLLAGCLFTAVWLIYTNPVSPDPTTAVAQTSPDPTPTATPSMTPTAEPEPSLTAEAEAEPTNPALPTLAPTAVPLPTLTETVTIPIPPVTATLPPPTPTVTPEPTVLPLPTAVSTITAPNISGEAEIPPSIIPPPLPSGADAPPLVYYPTDGQTRQANDIDLLGIAQPNSTLELLVNGEPFALIPIVSLDGRWFYSYVAPPGEYSFVVRYLNASDRASEPLAVVLVAPPAEENCIDPTPGQDLGDSYIVGDCEWLLGIARKLDVTYFDLLRVNPELANNPNFLISGQRLRLPPRE